MDLKELAVLAMAGLLVKKLSFILFGFLFFKILFSCFPKNVSLCLEEISLQHKSNFQ